MHDISTRQLIAPAIALVLIFFAQRGNAEDARWHTTDELLQAAKLMEAALAARDASPEEWRKLDGTYASLIAKNPRDVEARNARAEFLWNLGDQDRAVEEWEAAEKIDPENARVLDHLGNSALARGEARKSASYYERAVACEPGNAARHFALANVWFLFRHELLDATHRDAESLITGALSHFAEASRLAPTHAEYTRAYAETFYSLPKPDWGAALSAWQHLESLGVHQEFARLNQARIQIKLGQFDAARASLSKVQDAKYQTLMARLTAQIDSQTEKPFSPLSPTQ